MAEEINNSTFVLKLNNHKTPQFKEVKGKDWVVYGAEHPFYNTYPNYLLELYLNSTYHNAIVNAKHQYIVGNGIEIDKRGLKVGQLADLLDKSLQANKYKENLADIASKCVLDMLLFNGAHIEIVWARNGKTFDYYHMDYCSLRRDKEDKGWWYSNDWSKSDQSEEKTGLKFIPDFDPENTTGTQIYSFKKYTPGIKYYPMPDYKGAMPYIEADVEIGNFDLNRIKTGFFVGTILNFVGKPGDKEKEDIEKNLKRKFTGTDATNSILLTFCRDKDSRPDILRLPPDELDKQFAQLTASIEQRICTAHRVSPMLVGIKTEGQLGGRSELETQFQLLKNTFVEPFQNMVESWFNQLLSFKGFGKRVKLVGTKPLNMFTPEQIAADMTAEERREAMGLPRVPVKTESQTMSNILPVEQPDEDDDDEEESVKKEMELFRERGVNEDDYDLFGGIEVEKDELDQFSVIDSEDVKDIYKNILDQLSKDPLMDNETLANVLKVKPEKVARAIDALVEAEAIEVGTQGKGDLKVRKIKVLPAGKSVLENQGAEIEALEVRYKYEARPGMQPVIETTRPFCREMMKLKRLWSRDDIQQLSVDMGYNVWTDRGGWWTRKGGKIKTPYCRHVFKSYLVRKKKK